MVLLIPKPKDGSTRWGEEHPDDWTGAVRKPYAGLAVPWSELVTGSDDDEGGLKRHPALPEETIAIPEPQPTTDAGLLDDAEAKRMGRLARSAACSL